MTFRPGPDPRRARFAKGNQGSNPPLGTEARAALERAREQAGEILDALWELATDPVTPPNVRLGALTQLADRIWGKPVAPLAIAAVSAPEPIPDLSRLSIEDLRQFRELMSRIEPPTVDVEAAS
jgi:hypothetical protein